MTSTFAVDFETYYASDYSLSNMSVWAYVHDPKFNPYMIAIYGVDADGQVLEYVGPPSEFKEWDRLNNAVWLMHNAGFDSVVFERAQELGIIPAHIRPAAIHDTADMAAYLKLPRDLAGACRVELGFEPSKAMRSYMKGKTWAQAIQEGKAADLCKYALDDSKNCKSLWDSASPRWPEEERTISTLTREAVKFGVAVNEEAVDNAISKLSAKLFEVEEDIPWEWDEGKTPLARTKIKEECRKAEIPIPSSFAQNDPDCLKWEEDYSDRYPWIKAIRDWRRINMLLQKVRMLRQNLKPDSTFSPSMMYFGAHTGRWSGGGDAKFNVQNLPRKPMFEVDLRAMIVPRPGKKFVLIDYAQIEARALLWVVGDVEFIKLIEKEGNLYQAYAKQVGGYTGDNLKEDDKNLYQFYKACVLSLGYGCGANKFQAVAATQYGVELSMEEAEAAVQTFRRRNPRITRFWYELQKLLEMTAREKEDLDFTLPSGRVITYYKPLMTYEGLKAMLVKDSPRSYRKVYGGLLTENIIQALCRDVLRDGWIALYRNNMAPLFTVHDEFVNEFFPEEIDEPRLRGILNKASPWAQGLPLDFEFKVCDHYVK